MMSPMTRRLVSIALGAALAMGGVLVRGAGNEDANAIARLRQVGFDLSKPQTIDFAFFFRARQSAERVAPKLTAQGFETRILATGGGKDCALYARKRLVVSEAVMLDWRRQFEALAAAEQGEYEGWGAR